MSIDQRVIAGMTMSVDGFVTGPEDHLGQALGREGERLHLDGGSLSRY